MNINVKQFRKELNRMITEARAEIAEREQGIAKAEQTLKMLDTFDSNANGHRRMVRTTKPSNAIGVTEAIFKTLSPENGALIGTVIEKVVALKPYSNSADLPRTITATVAGLLRRGAIKRRKTSDGWSYFAKQEKPATSTAKAAA